MEERRKFERFRTVVIMQYKDRVLTARTDALTRDVSLGGVSFYSDKKFKEGQPITLRLFYDARGPAKVFKGRIVWSREASDVVPKGYLNGLAFIR